MEDQEPKTNTTNKIMPIDKDQAFNENMKIILNKLKLWDENSKLIFNLNLTNNLEEITSIDKNNTWSKLLEELLVHIDNNDIEEPLLDLLLSLRFKIMNFRAHMQDLYFVGSNFEAKWREVKDNIKYLEGYKKRNFEELSTVIKHIYESLYIEDIMSKNPDLDYIRIFTISNGCSLIKKFLDNKFLTSGETQDDNELIKEIEHNCYKILIEVCSNNHKAKKYFFAKNIEKCLVIFLQ